MTDLFQLEYVNTTHDVLYYLPGKPTQIYENIEYNTLYLRTYPTLRDITLVSNYCTLNCSNTNVAVSTSVDVLAIYNGSGCEINVKQEQYQQGPYFYWVFVKDLSEKFCLFTIEDSAPATIFFKFVNQHQHRILLASTIILLITTIALLAAKCFKNNQIHDIQIDEAEAGEFINKVESDSDSDGDNDDETTEIRLNKS